jgi:hypothetical protein
LFNRDQSTPLLEPDKWNADTLVIDAWKKNIYIKGEFIPQYYNTAFLLSRNASILSFAIEACS